MGVVGGCMSMICGEQRRDINQKKTLMTERMSLWLISIVFIGNTVNSTQKYSYSLTHLNLFAMLKDQHLKENPLPSPSI